MKLKINKKIRNNMVKVPDIIKEASKKLRKNMTDSEKKLWYEIHRNKLWVKFLRQKPIYVYTENSGLDRFIIPDFVSLWEKIIIEVDGGIHTVEEILSLDTVKESLIKRLWYRIIRFTNEEIGNNIYSCIERLEQFIKSNSSSLSFWKESTRRGKD